MRLALLTPKLNKYAIGDLGNHKLILLQTPNPTPRFSHDILIRDINTNKSILLGRGESILTQYNEYVIRSNIGILPILFFTNEDGYIEVMITGYCPWKPTLELKEEFRSAFPNY